MPERVTVPVRVIPRSRSERIDAVRAGRLLLRVTAAPESGAANRAAAAVLANALGLRAADVRIERGKSSRDKELSIPIGAAADLAELFAALGRGGTAAGHAREARVR